MTKRKENTTPEIIKNTAISPILEAVHQLSRPKNTDTVPIWSTEEGVPIGPFTTILKEDDSCLMFSDTESTALFNILLNGLRFNPQDTDLLTIGFPQLFYSESISPAAKTKSLAELAILANQTSPDLQQTALRTIQGIKETFDGPSTDFQDMENRFNALKHRRVTDANLGYTLYAMCHQEPFGNLINSQLATVVDFDIVLQKRKELLKK